MLKRDVKTYAIGFIENLGSSIMNPVFVGFFCNLGNQTFPRRLKISIASFLKANFVEKSDMFFLMIWFSFFPEIVVSVLIDYYTKNEVLH